MALAALELEEDKEPPAPPRLLRVVAEGAPPRRTERLRVIADDVHKMRVGRSGRSRQVDGESAAALARVADLEDIEELPLVERPRTRADCENGPRPCPWVGCRHHLFLDVHPGSGSIKLNHPFTEVADLKSSCSLDLADNGQVSFADIGRHLGITLERARQIEQVARAQLQDGYEGRRRRRTPKKRA